MVVRSQAQEAIDEASMKCHRNCYSKIYLPVYCIDRITCTRKNIVPFQSIWPSRVTGLVVLAEIHPLSQVTQSLANFKKKMAINR